MKIVFVLTTRFLKFMDLPKVRKTMPGSQFVLIFGKSTGANPSIKQSVKTFFDRYYEVPSVLKTDEDPLPVLSNSAVEKVIRNEIANASTKDIRLVCLDEGNLMLAAQLRARFNFEGNRENDIKQFRDKIVMKEMLSHHNINIPKYIEFDKNRTLKKYYQELTDYLGNKFVLKPRRHAGSFGVYIINNYECFEVAANAVLKSDIQYEAEMFIEGDLYHCESIIKKGEIIFTVPGLTSRPQHKFLDGENILDMPLLKDNPLYMKIANFNQECLKILNAREGVYHLELFKSLEGELIFLEAAVRAPGALLIPLYEVMFGVNMAEQDFYLQCGFCVPINKELKIYGFARIISTLQGTVIECVEPDVLSECEIYWKVKKGDILGDRRSLADHACLILVWNKDLSILKEDFELMKDYKPLMVK